MNLLEAWVETPGATALVWTLVHSLWQGALVALLLAAALCMIRTSRARYLAACGALLVLLAGFGTTLLVERAENDRPISARTGAIRLAIDAAADSSSPGLAVRRTASDYLPWLAPLWIAGVLIFHLRSLAGWIGARRLRRTGICCPPAPWQERLDQLAARLRISRAVVLWESCLADVPVVIGFLRPVVLMPVGLLAGLPAAQVEALLLHELAHIRRYDYLVNLLQVFVEGVMFYHPAVWWMAAVIRAERENCCDDLVVATQGDAFQYATALTLLDQSRGHARQPALAASGGSLVKRIRRLLAQPETPRSALTPVFSAAILTVTLVAVMAAWQSTPQAPQPPAAAGVTTPYDRWVKEDVAYIISDAERAAFRALQTDAEREHFIEQFWLRRDPTPGTPANEYKQEHYRRIAYVNEQFTVTKTGLPGWKTDRGRIYIVYGPPDEKESHPSGGRYQRPAQEGGGTTTTFPFEQWLYRHIEGVGDNVIVEFVDPTMTGEYRMTMDPSEKDAMLSVPGTGPKHIATVQVLGSSAVISVPLNVYRNLNRFSRLSGAREPDAPVHIYGRILTKEGAQVTTFEDSVTNAAQSVRTIPLPLGSYRLELVVKHMANAVSDSIEFTVR